MEVGNQRFLWRDIGEVVIYIGDSIQVRLGGRSCTATSGFIGIPDEIQEALSSLRMHHFLESSSRYKRLMFGVVPELVEVKGMGLEIGIGSGVGTETGTEVLCILVSSEEDTIDGTRQEVMEPQTDANEGLGSDGGVSRESIWSWKVTLCLTQSIHGLCRVNQSSLSTAGKSRSNLVNKNWICRRVPQGNLTEI